MHIIFLAYNFKAVWPSQLIYNECLYINITRLFHFSKVFLSGVHVKSFVFSKPQKKSDFPTRRRDKISDSHSLLMRVCVCVCVRV